MIFQALTAAERKKKYIEKMKATGQYDDFKKKKAADERDRQKRNKIGLEQLPKAVREKTKRLSRERNRNKAATYRLLKKNQQVDVAERTTSIETVTSQSIEPYKTQSAASKAFTKIKRSLPSTTAKQKVMAKKFLRLFNVNDRNEIVSDVISPVTVRGSRALNPDVVKEIRTFYERDDVSRVSPNMRDARKFADPITGAKEIKPIRYLMYKLTDAHKLFLQHMLKGKDCVDLVMILCCAVTIAGFQETIPINRLGYRSSARYVRLT